jgi:DNA-binding transcriptional LysR family regulator
MSQVRLLHAMKHNGFNISRAALSLGMAQPAASRALSSLEREMGCVLFVRNSRRISGPTTVGKKIYEQIDRIAIADSNLQTIEAEQKHMEAGALRIATTHVQARYCLPAIIKVFRERWPDVQVSLVQGMPRDLIGYLLEGVADIAICTEELKQHSNLNSKGFYRWFHAVCAPLEHDIFSEDVTLKRLAKQPILTYIHNITCRDSLDRAFQKQKLHPNIVLEAADTDVLKTFIRLKMGCGVVASMAYSPQEDSGLKMAALNEDISHFEACAAWLKERYLRKFEKSFLQLLEEEGPKIEKRMQILHKK